MNYQTMASVKQLYSDQFAGPADMRAIARRGRLQAWEREIEKDRLRSLVSANPPRPHDVAECASKLAALDLGISAPTVRPLDFSFIPRTTLGFPRQGPENFIYVRLTEPAHLVARVAAHETRHRWQIQTGSFGDLCRRNLHERDAEIFTHEFGEKYL